MEKYEEAKSREHATMIRSRKIAADLGLQMKIGDVEYQGDGNKAIFYYIADERVDFRQLIKVLAEAFRVRIEMKQIGARQEAGRIGGIGPCGRELCCATWMTNFVSVSTGAARYQDISLNPQKLAGQCAKLKCCLNYEVDAYVECQKRLPSKEIVLETLDATYFFFKADILKGEITYSTDKSFLANEVTIPARRAFEIINMNKRGEKPEKMQSDGHKEVERPKDLLEQESLTRFDKSKNAKKKKRKSGDNNKNANRADNRDNRADNRAEQAEAKAANTPAGNEGAEKQPNNENKPNERRPRERNGQNERRRDRNDKGNRPNRPQQEKPANNNEEKNGNGNAPKVKDDNQATPQEGKPQGDNNRRQERNNRNRPPRRPRNNENNENRPPRPPKAENNSEKTNNEGQAQ